MSRKYGENLRKANAGKLVAGVLIGSVIGATVGWLTTPASGTEIRRRLRGQEQDIREKHKTAEGNVENRVRELVEHRDKHTRAGQEGPDGQQPSHHQDQTLTRFESR